MDNAFDRRESHSGKKVQSGVKLKNYGDKAVTKIDKPLPMSWPSNIPHDLRLKLEELDRSRWQPKPADIWGVVKEWLESHQVDVPEDLPTRPRPLMPGHEED